MKCEEKYLKNTSDDAVVTVVKRLSNHYNVGENREWRVREEVKEKSPSLRKYHEK